MEDFLILNEVKCGYSKSFMLEGISFNVKKGSFTGIIGPNGSGKTTLFKGITGTLPLKSGSITLNGVNMASLTTKHKAQKMAIVSQYTDIVDISVQDYVLMGRIPYKKHFQFFDNDHDFSIAEKYMKLTGVYKYKDKYLSELSGGEQQLTAIARALTQEPELLLLDEPTSHLDISHQLQVLNLIQKLNTELNLTVLMIIHDLNLAGEYCNFLVMMNQGAVHIHGNPDEVLTYQHIEDVYHTVVITQQNPLSKKPAVFLVSDKVLKERAENEEENEATRL